jgi:hypothetical protein
VTGRCIKVNEYEKDIDNNVCNKMLEKASLHFLYLLPSTFEILY